MNLSKSKALSAIFTAGVLCLGHAESGYSQDNPQENASDLLHNVAKTETDERIGIKQTEVSRLQQDLEQTKKDAAALQKDMDATNAMIQKSGPDLDKLSVYRKVLNQEMQVNELQMEALDKRSDGLKRLSAAQSRELDALNQRMAEMDARSQLDNAEVQLLTKGQPIPGVDNDERAPEDLAALRKKVASDEAKTMEADRVARESLKSAAVRISAADEADAQVKKMAEAIGKSVEPVAERTDEAAPIHRHTPKPMMKPAMTKPAMTPPTRVIVRKSYAKPAPAATVSPFSKHSSQ